MSGSTSRNRESDFDQNAMERWIRELLLERFFENFAKQCANEVVSHQVTKELFEIATEHPAANLDTLPKQQRTVLVFRAAYVVETIYFDHYESFAPYMNLFVERFAATTNHSARRHFGKIMFDVIRRNRVATLTDTQTGDIAEACVQWVVDDRGRPAEKIWAMEVLIKLRKRVDWIGDILPDLMAPFLNDTRPSLVARVRRWRKITKFQ